MKTIRVLVADDHDIVRAGLRALLSTAADIQVVGEATNGLEAVRETERLRPNVVLLDLAMPRLNGLGAARRIARAVPQASVLVLSSYSDAQHVRQAVEAGVAGYLIKESAAQELLEAIRETAKGGAFLSPSISTRLLEEWSGASPGDDSTTPGTVTVSGRLTEVLQLIAEGYCSKQIAELLGVSTKTVEKHRQSLMDKLDCHSICNLTRYAVANGVVEISSIPARTPGWSLTGSPW